MDILCLITYLLLMMFFSYNWGAEVQAKTRDSEKYVFIMGGVSVVTFFVFLLVATPHHNKAIEISHYATNLVETREFSIVMNRPHKVHKIVKGSWGTAVDDEVWISITPIATNSNPILIYTKGATPPAEQPK